MKQERRNSYDNGSCLPEDRLCHVISQAHKIIHEGAINCDYFLRVVLPLQPELNIAVWHELLRDEDQASEGWKECVRATSPSSPAATASTIAQTVAQQPNKPEAGKSSAVTGIGRKHRRDRYPLGRKKSRKINASRTPRRGRTTDWSSCFHFENKTVILEV